MATTDRLSSNPHVQHAESLYRSGRTEEVAACVRAAEAQDLDDDARIRLRLVHGMALFDLGDAVGAIQTLGDVVEASRRGSIDLQFTTAFALFVRQTDFHAPEFLLPALSRLRQLASSIGDAHSLAGLHLAVGRLEGYRGHCVDAHRHLEIARRFAERGESLALRLSVDLFEGSLESVAGNLARFRTLSESCFERATAAGFSKYTVGAATNLGMVAICAGNMTRARAYLKQAIELAEGITYVKLCALDNLARVSLFEDDLDACHDLLAQCASVIAKDTVPARSWYDLDHQLTRCAYFERFGDWDTIIGIADDVDPELTRRQLKALRTTLLCAKARALAHLGRYAAADAALATAVRTCPRGAVDPLIVLEASTGLCLSLRGDNLRGSSHFDRALAACRAIGHRYHELWIDRDWQSLAPGTPAPPKAVRRGLDVTDTALLLSDVATILGAGHSIDLLAHRVAEVLQSTTLGPRVEVRSESGREYQAEPSALWEAEADGTFKIRLRGSDRLVSVHVRDVHAIEEIALLKSVVDLVQAAVSRTADAETEDEDQTLWPRSLASSGEDTVFQSPRMAELLRIAVRLAATDLPVLLSGETGTGKDIVARLIHEHSRVKRGPFIAFNCSAMPRDLVESQLFGHRRGAFTGATDAFPGVIRAAERGTLFLDEVGDLDLAIQPKLLRFLESSEIHPVGDMKPQRIPVRIVAATNADLDDRAEHGRFRRDLFYRLGVARLALPPLRERKDEIPALASLFLARYARDCERQGLRLGDDLIAALLLYNWPGNIRQLANELRRIVAMAADGQTLSAADLSAEILKTWNARPTTSTPTKAPAVSIRLDQTLDSAVDELERTFIAHAMETAGGRVADAAQLLGVSRKGLFLKRRRQGGSKP